MAPFPPNVTCQFLSDAAFRKTVMADKLAAVLSKPTFDADGFVKRLAEGGEDELEESRKKVQRLADETAVALKRNVYKHYSQFIETAKEISILEGEMYQLSHMLTDQKTIISSMLELSLTSNTVDTSDLDDAAPEDDSQKNLAFLLERVEGCSSVTESPGRHLVHDGDLVEVEPESFAQLQKMHAFLLNDSLMLASWLPHRRGPVKYKLQCLYELDSLAVVNVRDVGSAKNAFKILMFPDIRMFQAETPKAKRQWLDILEDAKKKKTALDNQRKELVQSVNQIMSPVDSTNPFADDIDVQSPMSDRPPSTSMLEQEYLHVDWVQELPEDLDVCIAQRDFEGAVDHVERVNAYLEACPKVSAMREYRSRIDHRVKQLTDVLMAELQASPEKSICGGPRAARRAVTQLIRLGKSAQACELFLSNRSSIIKYNLRQLKIEGSTGLYVRRISEVFFANMLETGREFSKAFPDHYGCFSSFVVWAQHELQQFLVLFNSQVFANKTSFSTVTECISEARTRCNQLNEIGLEMTFTLDKLMAKDVEKAVSEAGNHQMEAIRHRAAEDQWRPMNFENAALMAAFEAEMKDIGLTDIHKFTYDQCFSHLTPNTVQFARTYLAYVDGVLALYSPDHHQLITDAFTDLLTEQQKHVTRAARDHVLVKEKKRVVENGRFLAECLIAAVRQKYETRTRHLLPQLNKIAASLTHF